MKYDCIIIGGGVAGLTCAKELYENGHQNILLLEAQDKVGGRISTERNEGFLLDRGFQVLQTGYPDLDSYLNLEQLKLQPFPQGIIIRYKGKFHVIAAPWKHPGNILSTVAAPIGTIGDRFKLLKLIRSVCNTPLLQLFDEEDDTALSFLQKNGFSNTFIQCFFKPFFAGATLELTLGSSSNVLKYLIRVFAMGDACLPENGMESIPQQIAAHLPAETIRCNSYVKSVDQNTVTLSSGEQFEAETIIFATEEPSLKDLASETDIRKSVSETNIYFHADWQPPISAPFLILNGDGEGPINNLAFPSLVSSRYAPAGKTLISIVVLGEEWHNMPNLIELVQNQCKEWFGQEVDNWTHLKTVRIDHALPDQSPPVANPLRTENRKSNNTIICGEHLSLPGLLWAMMSGRKAAEKIIK